MVYILRFLQYILLPLLFPITNILLPLFSSFFKKRISFERKNVEFLGSTSFRIEGKKAKIAVEISSEGELEQIRPLIDFHLANGDGIEIIFSSESVENNLLKLQKENCDLIRIFRLPLVSYFPFSKSRSVCQWMTAEVLFLCRYDFYPELFLKGLDKKLFFILVEATLLNKIDKIKRNPFYLFLWRKIYNSFDFIICSTESDKKNFIEHLKIAEDKVDVGEFRIIQIQKRLDNAFEKLMKFPFWPLFHEFLEGKNRKQLMLFGNFWDSEATLFNNEEFIKGIKKGKYLCAIVPHLLKEENLSSIYSNLHQVMGSEVPIYQLNGVDSEERTKMVLEEISVNPGIIMLNFRGILLELYLFFGHVYVGGGFGRSVHSVLEPYLAGARIYLGSRIFRSTEFSTAKENSPEEVHVLQSPDHFFQEYKNHKDNLTNLEQRKILVKKTLPIFNQLVTKLREFQKNRSI